MSEDYSFVPATPEQVEFIRKQLGTNKEDISRAVASLREWLEMQPHLPDHIDDSRIGSIYINCKCSMERAKQAVDAYFSLKTKFPEILMNRDPIGSDIQYATQHVKLMVMPRLTKQLYRVLVITGINGDASTMRWPAFAKLLSFMSEAVLAEDYSLGDVLLYDLANVHIGHVVGVDINIVRAMERFYKTVYCRRLKGIHFLNATKVIDACMKVVNMALSEKLQRRVHVHLPGSSTLFEHVERDCVPDELGGTAGPVDKFAYGFLKKAETMREWYLEQDKYTSDESRRPADNHYGDGIYGIQGSFKKLVVD